MYQVNSDWYFMVRGGESKGPFSDRFQAQQALDHFITTLSKLHLRLED